MEKKIDDMDILFQNLANAGQAFMKSIDEFAALLEQVEQEQAMRKFNRTLFLTITILIAITSLLN